MKPATLLTDCPSCGAQNRLYLDRFHQRARCGRCKTDLATDSFYAAEPVEVTEGQFDPVARNSPIPVLVDFWAAWCGPCKAMAPILDQMAAEMAGRVLVLKVDTDASPLLAARYQIKGIPTMLLLRHGIEVERIVGAVPGDAVKARIEPYLSR